MNPAVDIGQVEGCFIMGAGAFLTEEQVRQYAKVIHVFTRFIRSACRVVTRVLYALYLSTEHT